MCVCVFPGSKAMVKSWGSKAAARHARRKRTKEAVTQLGAKHPAWVDDPKRPNRVAIHRKINIYISRRRTMRRGSFRRRRTRRRRRGEGEEEADEVKRALASLVGPLPVGKQPSWAAKAASLAAAKAASLAARLQVTTNPGSQSLPPPTVEPDLGASMEAAQRRPSSASVGPPRSGDAARPVPPPPGLPPSVSPPSDPAENPAEDPWSRASQAWQEVRVREEPWWLWSSWW